MNRTEDYELISIDNKEQWNSTIKSCGEYDSYHLAEYHQLAYLQGEGRPLLFSYSLSGHHAALPFLVRSLSGVDGLEDFEACDGTSVYGYPGLLSSMNPEDPDAGEFRVRFQEALERALRKLSVIAFFTRQNPLIDSSWLLGGLAQIVSLCPTISISLRKPEAEQIKDMTKGHRYDIRKAIKYEVRVREADYFESLDNFISIYDETMNRTGAGDYYRFSKRYFLLLKECLGDAVRLYIAEAKGKTVAASMFLFSDKIIQYHLSGAPTAYLSLSGSKAIIDEVRRRGTDRGFTWLHLGGGVGSTTDSLFRFKSGFSNHRSQFKVIKWILDPIIYNEAVNRAGSSDAGFFPAYRTPLKTKSCDKSE
jgi:hypothetical protein